MTVVLSGSALRIEHRDGRPGDQFELTAGQVDWDEPSTPIHRAINVGRQAYEEITIFFLDHPEAVPQPAPDDGSS